jgi:hypothetical protein
LGTPPQGWRDRREPGSPRRLPPHEIRSFRFIPPRQWADQSPQHHPRDFRFGPEVCLPVCGLLLQRSSQSFLVESRLLRSAESTLDSAELRMLHANEWCDRFAGTPAAIESTSLHLDIPDQWLQSSSSAPFNSPSCGCVRRSHIGRAARCGQPAASVRKMRCRRTKPRRRCFATSAAAYPAAQPMAH